MGKVRVGIIGCGHIAVTHAEALQMIPEAEYAACADNQPGRADAFAGRFGGKPYTDMKEMLRKADLDAVLVCTPHPAHSAAVIAAAEAGVNVMTEKPMTVSLREADDMIEATKKANVKFGVIFQRRFWPAAQRLHQAIQDGKLGKVVLGDLILKWWRSKEYYEMDPWRGRWDTEGGGVLINQAIHAVDMFQWFMGPVDYLFGQWDNFSHPYREIEDTAVATIRFKSGAVGVLSCTVTANPSISSRICVTGDNGAVASVTEEGEGPRGINDVWTIRGEQESVIALLEQERGQRAFPDMHQIQIREFLQAIQENRESAVTGEQARRSLEIILAIYESQRTGKVIKFPLPY